MINKEDLGQLVAMHEYCRPHQSETEREFIKRFIKPLHVVEDRCGNLFKQIGTVEEATILWSCHTDTVHDKDGKQQLMLGNKRFLFVSEDSKSSCLGADNTAGVWMLIQMIQKGIPGFYVFHRGEERGCVGSKYVLDKAPNVLKLMKAAIAFDRMGTLDIIDHQIGSRCCSKEFVKSLADGLGMKHTPAFGMYTDTATYTHIIPECSNVSVGYYSAHSPDEYLNIEYLCNLRDAVFKLDLSKLVIARDPTKFDTPYAWGYWKQGRKGKKRWRPIEPEEGDMPTVWPNHNNYPRTGTSSNGTTIDVQRHYAKAYLNTGRQYITLENFCRAYPAIVADYLEQHGIDIEELHTYLDAALNPPKQLELPAPEAKTETQETKEEPPEDRVENGRDEDIVYNIDFTGMY